MLELTKYLLGCSGCFNPFSASNCQHPQNWLQTVQSQLTDEGQMQVILKNKNKKHLKKDFVFKHECELSEEQDFEKRNQSLICNCNGRQWLCVRSNWKQLAVSGLIKRPQTTFACRLLTLMYFLQKAVTTGLTVVNSFFSSTKQRT